MTVGEPENRAAQRPARRVDIVVCELDGEAVLYDERSGAVHRFNETALTVWKACDGSRCVSEISQALTQRYALGSGEALTEAEKVIRDLEAKGLLIERPDPTTRPASRLPSRREMLCGGTAKLIYTAPLISTFFASGACASGPSASAAFGTDGFGNCKNLGYSCTTNPDCCEESGDKTACRDIGGPTAQCCVKTDKDGCTFDTQCCNYPTDTCNAGMCN